MNPSALLSQVVRLAGAITVDVVDSHSTRTVTLVGSGTTRYARVYLADTGAAGTTAAAPWDVLDKLEDTLNAAPGSTLWTVRLDPVGAVRITYLGTGTGTLTWSGTNLRNLLGFNVGISLGAGASELAAFAPGGCIVATCADENDNGWQPVATGVATGETLAGTVVAVDSGHRKLTRSLVLRLLPYTLVEQTAGEYLTPAFAQDIASNNTRWSSPSSTAYFNGGGYSAHEFLATVHRIAAAPAAFAIGSLQELIAGSESEYDVGYVSSETLRGSELFPLSVPGWYARRDLVLRLNRTERDGR